MIATLPAAEKGVHDEPFTHPVAFTRMLTNRWALPALDDLDDVAQFLDLTQSELGWFADPRHLAREASAVPLQHYRVSHRLAPSGAIRVLEAPKLELKRMQRGLLDDVVSLVPPHAAARGFRPGGSVRSYAAPHVDSPVVIRLDLEAFFASVTVARVYGIWRTAGYPEPVAHCLAGLLTTVLPRSQWRAVPRPANNALLDAHWRLGRRLAVPHLPQGAPTSPALANLAAFRLDVRLTALARSWGGRYTRYADDLALSGGRGWATGTSRLLDAIDEVVRDEGFRLNPAQDRRHASRGTSNPRRSGRQHRPRVARPEVDNLRAILHNCRRLDPAPRTETTTQRSPNTCEAGSPGSPSTIPPAAPDC